jgi:hypothetical protein
MSEPTKTRIVQSLTVLFCIAVDLAGALHGLLLS